MSYSLNELYRVMQVSKQSVQQSRKRQLAFEKELSELLILANEIKQEHPGCGIEKLYYTLMPTSMGRDKFCEIFMSLGYGVKRVTNYHRTTISGGIQYPNLIEGMQVTRPFQVLQSDITYYRLLEQHYYLVFIVDVYTRLILGYGANNHLRAEANEQAMRKALDFMDYIPWQVIHHSDHGTQYGSKIYTSLLTESGIHISMGNVAWENPYAERVNGIIKNEYLKHWQITNFKQLKQKLDQAVSHYNNQRLHRAFHMKYTPVDYYKNILTLPPQERPTVNIYTEGRINFKGASSPSEVNPRKDLLAHNCPMEI